METINLQVLVNDIEYGEALKEALTRNYPGFIVYMGKQEEGMIVDIKLFDDLRCKDKRGIYLTEKISLVSEGKRIFYKYGNMKKLVGDILLTYSQMTGRVMAHLGKGGVEVMGVFSSAGGLGATSVALGLAQEFQRFWGKKVLYLSFEPLPSTGDYFIDNEERGMGEYLYHFMKGNKVACSYIEAYLQKDDFGVETFVLPIGYNPILGLPKLMASQFVGYLAELGRYNLIIIDIGNTLGHEMVQMAALCDKTIVLQSKGHRQKSYDAYWTNQCGEPVDGSMLRLINKYVLQEEQEIVSQALDIIHGEIEEGQDELVNIKRDDTSLHRLIYDPNSFHKGGYRHRITLDLDFGSDIRELAKELQH